MANVTDRIQKQVLLNAPRERVWRAITDAEQFGAWFGAEFEGQFIAGRRLRGKMVPTRVDPEVAKSQEAYAGIEFEIVVELVDPMHAFAFRWYPYEPGDDSASVPMTLVTFEIHDAAEGTLLTITESGFDAVPLAKRAEAFKANEQGWAIQSRLIEKYLRGE
jgi:uncharacterized protein YndB with AHSA1/START domain